MEKRKLNRRDFLRLSTAVATGAIVAACAPAAPQIIEVEKEVPVEKVVKETVIIVEKEVVVEKPAKAPEKITLRFHGRSSTMDDIYVDLCKEYMAEHPNVTIEYERTASGEYLQKQLIMAAAGTLGDAVGPNWPTGLFYKFAYNGLYLDHLPLIEAANFDLDALLPHAVEVVTIDGKVYGLPHSAHSGTSGMFINKTIFEEAGVPIPEMEWTQEAHPGLKDWTYDDALEAALALTKREGGRTTQFGLHLSGTTGYLYTMLQCFGGAHINPEGTKTTLDTPESTAAIQWIADLYNKHKVSPRPTEVPTGGPDLFASGKVAMTCAQVYRLERARQSYKHLDWMVIPMPRGKAGLHATLGTDVWGVLATSKHPQVAFDVISTFASYETGVRQVEFGGVPGSHKKVWENPDLLKDPNFAVFARSIQTATPVTISANLRGDEWATEWLRLFSPLWAGEETDVQKVIKEATVRLDEILAKPRAGLTI